MSEVGENGTLRCYDLMLLFAFQTHPMKRILQSWNVLQKKQCSTNIPSKYAADHA
jgi:hypothetical protein